MEGDNKGVSNNLKDENRLSESSVPIETKIRAKYGDEVIVSQPTLSSKSTLQPDTLELR